MERKEAQGDWDVRGLDVETALIGEVHGTLIAADWRVRQEFGNGFPNWIMYRTAIAGDALYIRRLREWVVAFSIAYATTGGMRKDAYSEELACVAGWDALHILIHCRQLQPHTVSAEELGVDPKTYLRFRNSVYKRLHCSLMHYWSELIPAYNATRKAEHKSRL